MRPSVTGPNWIIKNNEITNSTAAGVDMTTGANVAANSIRNSGQKGYTILGSNVVFSDNEIAGNNPNDAYRILRPKIWAEAYIPRPGYPLGTKRSTRQGVKERARSERPVTMSLRPDCEFEIEGTSAHARNAGCRRHRDLPVDVFETHAGIVERPLNDLLVRRRFMPEGNHR